MNKKYFKSFQSYEKIKKYCQAGISAKAGEVYILDLKIKKIKEELNKLIIQKIIYSIFCLLFFSFFVAILNDKNEIATIFFVSFISLIGLLFFGALSYYVGELIEDKEILLKKINEKKEKIFSELSEDESFEIKKTIKDFTENVKMIF